MKQKGRPNKMRKQLPKALVSKTICIPKYVHAKCKINNMKKKRKGKANQDTLKGPTI